MATPSGLAFTLFPLLAPELRIQIYQHALPTKVPPALYPYKIGCWQPSRGNPTGLPEYDANGEELDLNYNFRYDLLDPIPVSPPLAFVCHEAREVVLAWAVEHGLELMEKQAKRKKGLFSKPFDPIIDILYVSRLEWDAFAREADERQFEADLLGLLVNVTCRNTTLAIPDALVRSCLADLISDLHHLLEHWWWGVSILLIVVDPQPEFLSEDGDAEMELLLPGHGHGQWGVESVPGGSFVWNLEQARFDYGVEEFRGDKELYMLAKQACKELGEGILTKDKKSDFEIRLVRAVKR